MNYKDLVFVDTETTGLDPSKHEVIELAWIVTTPDAMTVKSQACHRILPVRLDLAEPKALEVNQYSEDVWRSGPLVTHAEAVALFNTVSAGKILVGQNVSFDEGFLTSMFDRVGQRHAWAYHKVDTVALAWPLYATTELPNLKLETLCAFLNIPQERRHAADADVLSCYNVYKALMKRYATVK